MSQPPKRAAPQQHYRKKRRGRKPSLKPKHALTAANAMEAAGMRGAADFDGSLQLDTDFALEASAPMQCPDVAALPAWACPAGRIRLLARQQARSSAMAAQMSAAEHEGALKLSTNSGGLETTLQQGVADGLQAPMADVEGHESFAGTSAVFAEYETLYQMILKWA